MLMEKVVTALLQSCTYREFVGKFVGSLVILCQCHFTCTWPFYAVTLSISELFDAFGQLVSCSDLLSY